MPCLEDAGLLTAALEAELNSREKITREPNQFL
jgi:hypothetical protein